MLNPDLFKPEAIAPETQAFNAQIEALLAEMHSWVDLPAQVTRAQRDAGEGIFGPVTLLDQGKNRTIAGPAGEIPLRVFVPDVVKGVYLHIHGGGWVLGPAGDRDPTLWAIAEACQVAVVSVDYRLAPEHPYPAAPDDCEAAALWLVENAVVEFGADRLIIGGESAGAHLAVVTLLRLRDRHGVSGFRGANLIYGGYDLTGTPSVHNWGERWLVLNTPIVFWFCDNFVPPEKRLDPDVSPLYADLTQMPPALFSVGTLDPLLDDSLFMASRWQAAGNRAELAIYPGGIHGFDSFPIALATQANERIHQFMGQVVDG